MEGCCQPRSPACRGDPQQLKEPVQAMDGGAVPPYTRHAASGPSTAEDNLTEDCLSLGIARDPAGSGMPVTAYLFSTPQCQADVGSASQPASQPGSSHQTKYVSNQNGGKSMWMEWWRFSASTFPGQTHPASHTGGLQWWCLSLVGIALQS